MGSPKRGKKRSVVWVERGLASVGGGKGQRGDDQTELSSKESLTARTREDEKCERKKKVKAQKFEHEDVDNNSGFLRDGKGTKKGRKNEPTKKPSGKKEKGRAGRGEGPALKRKKQRPGQKRTAGEKALLARTARKLKGTIETPTQPEVKKHKKRGNFAIEKRGTAGLESGERQLREGLEEEAEAHQLEKKRGNEV